MSKLKDKAIDIKGNDYVLVKDRVAEFNKLFENGSIVTTLESDIDSDMVVFKAVVTPNMDNPDAVFTGWSQAKWGDGNVNSTSAIENSETSAVGRALGFMGIGIIESIASKDEINKAQQDGVLVQDAKRRLKKSEKCPDCGALMKLSQRTGRLYCGKLCWKK